MRNWEKEKEKRVAFIRDLLATSGAKGVIFGNSGGKDSALVAALCSFATKNVLGVIMPCHSQRNYGEDKEDGLAVAQKYGIETKIVDLTKVRSDLLEAIQPPLQSKGALSNIAPRLRMTTLYAIGAERGYLVAGTGNKSERYMGYFTKWGDGACDFNPIADLGATEVFDFLRYLRAPREELAHQMPELFALLFHRCQPVLGVHAFFSVYVYAEKHFEVHAALNGALFESFLDFPLSYEGKAGAFQLPAALYRVELRKRSA